MLVTKNPYGNPENKQKAFEMIGHIDLDDALYKIAEISLDEMSDVEDVVYRRLLLCDFIK
jgi:hypothetical protein